MLKGIKKISAMVCVACSMPFAEGIAMANEKPAAIEGEAEPIIPELEEVPENIPSSVVIESEGKGTFGPSMSALQAKLLARRAAMVNVVANACKEVGASHGAIREIFSEDFDGKTYTIVANVQVWNN